MYDGLVYVHNAGSLKTELLKRLHNGKTAGHYEQDKTEDLVTRDWCWPGMKMWISQYVASCNQCQRYCRPRVKPVGKLALSPAKTAPYQSITWDHITDMPESRGSNLILVMVDRFSKTARSVACQRDNDARYLADLFMQEWVCLHRSRGRSYRTREHCSRRDFVEISANSLASRPARFVASDLTPL
jgi:hypothetical protein